MEFSEKENIARSKVCLPLDGLQTLDDVKARIEELHPVVGMFKIGKELFTRFGPEVVKLVQEYGCEVFLDLKYHDIPNTVKGATHAATQLGVYMFNVHASGGTAMMKAAVEGATEARKTYNIRMPKIIGVTVLTSIDQHTLNTDLRVPGKLEEQVLHLAKLAQQAGLNGIVCSAADLQAIKDKLPPDFLYITPGIKGPNTAAGSDQKRVFTPQNAIKDGASILVVGRAITAAPDRLKAGREVLADIAEAL
jgi:orotidine-5'-phosphate decarboxylase